MAKPEARRTPLPDTPVAGYKSILAGVLEKRPSGTRGRLAAALGKNRSFVSHIASPSYATPIPAAHIEMIFEVCHFSADERRSFLANYARAHPRRLLPPGEAPRMRPHTLQLPDLGDNLRNKKLQVLVGEFMHKLTDLLSETQ